MDPTTTGTTATTEATDSCSLRVMADFMTTGATVLRTASGITGSGGTGLVGMGMQDSPGTADSLGMADSPGMVDSLGMAVQGRMAAGVGTAVAAAGTAVAETAVLVTLDGADGDAPSARRHALFGHPSGGSQATVPMSAGTEISRSSRSLDAAVSLCRRPPGM